MYVTVREDHGAPPATATTAPRRRRVPRVVVTLGLVSLLTDVSSESVAAVLPLYLTLGLGLSTVAYGFVDSLYQGVGALVRIAGGWGADRSGRPKWVAFAGYATSCVARVGLLVATGAGAVGAIVALDRVGKGLRTGPRDAMISAAAPADSVGLAFGVHRALDTTGAVLGPLVAFALLWWIPGGYLTVMVVSLGFALVGLALLGLFVEDRPRVARRDPERAPSADPPDGPADGGWRELASPAVRRLLVVAGLLGLVTVGDGFLYLALLDQGGFAVHWFPLLYVGTSVTYLLLAVPLGALADRWGRARTMVLGHVALVAAYLAPAWPVGALGATVLTVVLLGLFYAATDGVLAAVAGRVVAPAFRARGIATAQTVVAVSRMGASAGFGLLWFWVGPANALLVVATVLACLVPPALLAVRGVDRAPVPA
ncbi:MFS transporter [Nocardioides zeae]|uniref:MFS transporter n=1 Tax=Nocardioides imazamoxiresistens TaxID=3231893 RepID=A0ABU3Q066_9ACTN|nr:MFS transporter [Nocardioides zeae]MDT9594516.1 MFS transporter [Nocardioides zeae]